MHAVHYHTKEDYPPHFDLEEQKESSVSETGLPRGRFGTTLI